MTTIEQVKPEDHLILTSGDITITGDVGDGAEIEVTGGSLTILGTVGSHVTIRVQEWIKATNIGDHCILQTKKSFISVQDIGAETSCSSNTIIYVRNTEPKCILNAGTTVHAQMIGAESKVNAGEHVIAKIIQDHCQISSLTKEICATSIGSNTKIFAHQSIYVAESVTNFSTLHSARGAIFITNNIGSNNHLRAYLSITLEHAGTHNKIHSESERVRVSSQGDHTEITTGLDNHQRDSTSDSKEEPFVHRKAITTFGMFSTDSPIPVSAATSSQLFKGSYEHLSEQLLPDYFEEEEGLSSESSNRM